MKRTPERPAHVRYSPTAYYMWCVAAALCAVGALFSLLVAEWGATLGFFAVGVSLAAHARLERLEGHRHGYGVEVPK